MSLFEKLEPTEYEKDQSYLQHWLRMADLLSAYGSLLSERMFQMLTGYYTEDMTLSEIADQSGVSRQAVHDSLKRGEEHLERYEKQLGIVARQVKLESLMSFMEDQLRFMPESTRKTESVKRFDEARKMLEEILMEGGQ